LVTVLYSKYGEDLAYFYSIVKVLKYIFLGRPCIVVLDCQNPEIIKLELVDPSFDIIKYFRKICQLLVVGSVYSFGMAIGWGLWNMFVLRMRLCMYSAMIHIWVH
jgi:uncharacterized membrane protein YciS (DUF1049 family)